MKAVAIPQTIEAAENLPTALLSAAAALPHLLKNAQAAAPARRDAESPRRRRLWGREDGFTMAGVR